MQLIRNYTNYTKLANVGNNGLQGRGNKFRTNLGPLVIHSGAFPTELTELGITFKTKSFKINI